MGKPQELRIGIYDCTDAFHGQLGGLTIEGFITFTLKEVVIPEESQRETLRKSRCHFFIDFHQEVGPWGGVSLMWNELIPDRRGWDCLFMGGRNIALKKRWPVEHPPTNEEILEEISGMLSKLPSAKFQEWLDRMTPPGWTLKAEERP